MNSSDKERIAELILSVKNQIDSIAQSKGGYTGGDQDSDDLLQDVYWECIEKSRTSPGFVLQHPKPKAKILQIARNICIDSFRHRRRFPFEGAAKDLCSFNVILEKLHEAMSSLPQHLSIVLSYRFIERRSRKEAAAMLNVSVHTITRRQQEAIELLKEHFDLPTNNLTLKA